MGSTSRLPADETTQKWAIYDLGNAHEKTFSAIMLFREWGIR